MSSTMMDYLDFLHNNLKQVTYWNKDITPLSYLSNNVFNFDTYSDEYDSLFAEKALEVCVAITTNKTFEYQKLKSSETWYLIMCHMPFFKDKITWGGSMRGAFWDLYEDSSFEIESCGFFKGDVQSISPMLFSKRQWPLFIEAMVNFALPHYVNRLN